MANPNFLSRRNIHRRQISMNSSKSTTDIQGESHLCFAGDFSWLQGNIISTEDDCNYSLYGERMDSEDLKNNSLELCPSSTGSTPYESDVEDDESRNSADWVCTENRSPSGNPYFDKANNDLNIYKLFITDHFTGLIYTLKNVKLNSIPKTANSTSAPINSNLSLLCSDEFPISFQVTNIFKGQKADMVIQKSLGIPCLLGKKCVIYTGNITISLKDSESIDSGRSWSL